jgi:hypothetical protein
MPNPKAGSGGSSVLEDPTGRRARWLRRGGRVVFVLFLAWLLAIVLGGLGLTPVPGVPLTHTLQPTRGLPPLKTLPKPARPSPSDLRPAVTAKAFAAIRRRTTTTTTTSHGKSATAPGRSKTTTVPAVRGRSTAHRKNTVAPGSNKKTTTATTTTTSTTTTHGKSTLAPGQKKP